MPEHHTVTVTATAPWVGMLKQMLAEEGVEVTGGSAGTEERGAGEFAEQVATNLVADGAIAAVMLAVKRFKKRVPKAKVEIDGEAVEDDDPPTV